VVSVASGAAEPAEDAIQWLKDNGYDVPDSAPGLLGPYLEDGLFLLALRLTKGADTGSIRPLVLTYDAEKPIIPVKLTSVAANDDMGVMTWLLGDGRGVPENYRSLELNEARINWFNAATNYNSVVIDAANDAGGQGFVTEFAGDTSAFAQLVWSTGEEDQWQSLITATYSSFDEMFDTFYGTYSSYDGFWDAIQASVTFTSSVTFEDFKLCPSCYSDEVTFSPSTLVAALESNVIEPMRVIQDLIDSHPTMTRLYTTLSADEMTIDPLFTFNKDLPDVSNLHTADRVIECRPDISQFEAPWRIELPNGGVIRGTAAELNAARGGTWPSPLAQLPPNLSVLQRSSTGSGKVLEDNTAKIGSALAAYNSGMAPSTVEGDAGTGPNPGMTAGPASTTGSVSSAGMTAPSASTPVKGPSVGADAGGAAMNGGAVAVDDKRKDSGGCNVAAAPARSRASLGWLALGAVALLRRTRARTWVQAG
jgi:hypothetical protein